MHLTPADKADRRAAEQTLRGDVAAFSHLVETYQAMVFSCALGITRNREDAADAAQETFVRLYRHLDQFDLERPLKPYLMTIAVNCARNIRRKHRPERSTDDDETMVGVMTDDSPGPEHALLSRERRRIVRDVIDALPAMLRDVCVLFYLNGCSCRETAGILRTSEGAVRVALHRAREKLQQSPLREWASP